MTQSASCESAQSEADAPVAINVPIANTTASIFRNRTMAEKVNDSESEVNPAARQAAKIAI